MMQTEPEKMKRNKRWEKGVMARALAGALALVTAVPLLAGCGGQKTPVSAEDFRKKMEEDGLQVVDQSENAPEDSGMTTVLVALEENEYQVELYVFQDEDSARGLYDTTKSGLQDNYKEVSGKVETSKNSGSYAKYTIQVDGGYVTIARIDNTLLYAKGLAEHKDDIKDAVEELGY